MLFIVLLLVLMMEKCVVWCGFRLGWIFLVGEIVVGLILVVCCFRYVGLVRCVIGILEKFGLLR